MYPALAVARSLRDRPDAPELEWLGGQRGLEAELVAAAGLPIERLVLRSLRSVERDIHLVLDPLVVRTVWQPRRAFQGWRYLKPADAPADLAAAGKGLLEMPPALRRELAELGLL